MRMSKLLTNFFILFLVLSIDLCWSASIRQQQSNYSVQTCQEVHNELRQKRLISASLHESSSKDVAGEICQSSCCPSNVEQQLLNSSTTEFELSFTRKIEDLASEIESHALLIQDILLSTMREGRTRMLDMFSEMYPSVRPLVAAPAKQLFSGFSLFFQSQQTELELEQSVATFFNSLLTVLYNSSQSENNPSLTPLFVACLHHKQRDLKPFNELPTLVAQRLLHMFGVARFYLQALFKSSRVLRSVGEIRASQKCVESSLRATHCAICHLQGNDPLCSGVCRQLLNPCTAAMRRIMGPSWADYLRQLQLLADSMRQTNNIRDYFNNMVEKLKLVMVNSQDAEGHKLLLNASCGSTEELAALAANITGLGHSTGHGGHMAASHGGRQKRFSGMSTLRVFSALPPRDSRDTSYNTPEKLSEALLAFAAQIDSRQRFFDTLSDQLCTEISAVKVMPDNFRSHAITSGVADCWPGIDSWLDHESERVVEPHDSSIVQLMELSNKLKFISEEEGLIRRADVHTLLSESILSVGREDNGRSYHDSSHDMDYDYTYSDYDYSHDYDYGHEGGSGSGLWPHYGDEEDDNYDYSEFPDYVVDDEDSRFDIGSGDVRGSVVEGEKDGADIDLIESTTLLIDVATESSAHPTISSSLIILTTFLISTLFQFSLFWF